MDRSPDSSIEPIQSEDEPSVKRRENNPVRLVDLVMEIQTRRLREDG
jgi:hypothetical protein